MAKTETLEREILGNLILNPVFLEDDEVGCYLKPGLFSGERNGKIFSIIAKEWEDSRPEQVSIVSIHGQLGRDADYISRLVDGIFINQDNFRRIVTKKKKALLAQKALQVGTELMQSFLKTDTYDPMAFSEFVEAALAWDCIDSEFKNKNILNPLSTIQPEPVSWLWENFLPKGMITLISGDPGSGKTWFSLDCAARISRGLPWPDGNRQNELGNVVYINIEDPQATVIRPRVDSLGGDPKKIFVITGDKEELTDLSSSRGIAYLESCLKKIPEPIRLLVIDPVIDFSGGTNPNAAEQVRQFLNPLANLADRFQTAVVLISHLNKTQTHSAIYRTVGTASGWMGKARAAFLIFRNQEEPKQRYIAPIKTNLAPEEPAYLSFYIEGGKLIYQKVDTAFDIEDHLNPERREEAPQLAEAQAFLKALFEDNLIIEAENAYNESMKAGISKRTLARAKSQLRIESVREGGRWKWKLSK